MGLRYLLPPGWEIRAQAASKISGCFCCLKAQNLGNPQGLPVSSSQSLGESSRGDDAVSRVGTRPVPRVSTRILGETSVPLALSFTGLQANPPSQTVFLPETLTGSSTHRALGASVKLVRTGQSLGYTEPLSSSLVFVLKAKQISLFCMINIHTRAAALTAFSSCRHLNVLVSLLFFHRKHF